MVGVFYHELFEKHLEGYPHPEKPDRVKAIMKRLRSFEPADSLRFIEAPFAERAWIERIHDPRYVNDILSMEITDAVILDWGDTVATPATLQAALHAAGAAVGASRMVLAGELASAFCTFARAQAAPPLNFVDPGARRPPLSKRPRATMTDEMREHLKSLGYLQ